jgi:hypothetical protein
MTPDRLEQIRQRIAARVPSVRDVRLEGTERAGGVWSGFCFGEIDGVLSGVSMETEWPWTDDDEIVEWALDGWRANEVEVLAEDVAVK